MTELRIPPVLRRYAGGRASVEVEGETVRAALADLFARWPDLRPRVLDEAGHLHPYLRLFAGNAQVADLDAAPGPALDLVAAAAGG